jgi:[citrate (pro-3S)-lyase] ligase
MPVDLLFDENGQCTIGSAEIVLNPSMFIDEKTTSSDGLYSLRTRYSKHRNKILVDLEAEDSAKIDVCYYTYFDRLADKIGNTGYRDIRSHVVELKNEGKYLIQCFIKAKNSHYSTAQTLISPWIEYKRYSLLDILGCNEDSDVPDENTIELIHMRCLISVALSNNVDVWAYLRSLGYKNIAVFSDSQLGFELYYDAYFKSCRIRLITSRRNLSIKRTLHHDGLELSACSAKNINYVDYWSSLDVILVADCTDNASIEVIQEKFKGMMFFANKLLSELILNKTIVEPIRDAVASNLGVQFIAMTNFTMIGDEKSTHELHIDEFMGNYLQHKYDEVGDPIFSGHNKDRKYVKKTVAPDSFFDENMLRAYKTTHSEYLNVTNGFRLTTNTPEHPANSIYMLGSSKIVGSYVADSETIPSNLQKIINNHNLNYEIINAANFYSNCDEQSIKLLKNLPIKSGDIVIVQIMTKCWKNLSDFIPLIDLTNIFRRPHPYGDIFFDHGHVNFIGNEIVAKIIYEKLDALDVFNQQVQQIDATGRYSKPINAITSEDPSLSDYIAKIAIHRTKIGAIVMNCNPFTLGHRYLIECACEIVSHLFIFVVEEDSSFFTFEERFQLVHDGVSDLHHITVIPSGNYIISKITFPAYSDKENLQEEIIDATIDVRLFGEKICPALGINIRFIGEEPIDAVTRQYNSQLKNLLPQYGVEVVQIPRKASDGVPISASRVRKLLAKQNFDEIKKLVPLTTLDYLSNKWKRGISCQTLSTG